MNEKIKYEAKGDKVYIDGVLYCQTVAYQNQTAEEVAKDMVQTMNKCEKLKTENYVYFRTIIEIRVALDRLDEVIE